MIPEDELGFASAFEITEDLVVMLAGAAGFDEVPFPRRIGVMLWEWIFPPPKFRALIVGAKNEIEIAIAVDIEGGAARFESEVFLFDDESGPARRFALVADQSGAFFTEADDEIIEAIVVEIRHQGARLLGGFAGSRKVAGVAGKMLPLNVAGAESDGDGEAKQKANTGNVAAGAGEQRRARWRKRFHGRGLDSEGFADEFAAALMVFGNRSSYLSLFFEREFNGVGSGELMLSGELGYG